MTSLFKKILFATSASPACDDAARLAFAMAKRTQADLLIFNDFATPTRAYSQFFADLKTGEDVVLTDEYKDKVDTAVREYYASDLDGCATCRIETTVGFPHREVLRIARDEQVDLIVMGGSTHDELEAAQVKKDFPGSTILRVAKAAKAPVLVVNHPTPAALEDLNTIVFATDLSPYCDRAFAFAKTVAKAVGASIHILHAGLDDAEVDEALKKKYLDKADGVPVTTSIAEGDAAPAIVAKAKALHAGLVVMAHHASHLDTEEEWHDAVLHQVLVEAPCPVVSASKYGA
ncbi:universal stress protein [Megalodesulfovibrio gigas]|uniref:Putative UspA domain-containing protein n=1 Tax=Megalodesulfovibrio gigas (strain ATCC 19364 / DSM 1382 / NCIMB 9332 / VKM B-1759) TaxID=1121448 RepID=T2G8M2_MEGG1|nr:universal stress protein [Megalodesulfovibrio gigas]AGW12623.1 putative UspA domain-containing protein [Megalodesulfovibrio gigas DSM 1382 = ATCC 19364]